VLHRVIGIAAGLRPIGIDRRPRQRDLELGDGRIRLELGVESEHGDSFAGQMRLVDLEPRATGNAQQRSQQH
jgi:hypothetical protein